MKKKRALSDRARELLTASAEERIAHIKKDVFLPYPRATALLKAMDDLLTRPQKTRPPNILILGRSNNGKSQLLHEFRMRHTTDEHPTGDATHAPVISIQAPPTPNDKLFLDRALRAFKVEPRKSATEGEKIDVFLEMLHACKTRVLLIDELHSILAGPIHKQLAMLNTFKYLSNESGVSIVAAGTAAAKDVMATETELANRFAVWPLPRWVHTDLEYRRLLQRFETVLPLREESGLDQPELANAIFDLSDGTIGGIGDAVRDTAIKAIETGVEAITLQVVEAVQGKRSGDRGDCAEV